MIKFKPTIMSKPEGKRLSIPKAPPTANDRRISVDPLVKPMRFLEKRMSFAVCLVRTCPASAGGEAQIWWKNWPEARSKATCVPPLKVAS